MLAVGNKSSKAIWESHRPRQFSRPIYSSPREEREKFIRAKYIDKEFLAELPESDRGIAEVSHLASWHSMCDPLASWNSVIPCPTGILCSLDQLAFCVPLASWHSAFPWPASFPGSFKVLSFVWFPKLGSEPISTHTHSN